MTNARIAAVATYLPKTVLDNDELSRIFPIWTSAQIEEKLGIRERRLAGSDETVSDMATNAARALFEQNDIDPASIDFVIMCSQTPDHPIPGPSFSVHERLALGKAVGALDVTLGCSGYVYCLSLAAGLIAAGSARRVLLLTADTYSKILHPGDRSVRPLFGDGATASLIEVDMCEGSRIGPFVFGTDGAGSRYLTQEAGGTRLPCSPETALTRKDAAGVERSTDTLSMNGPAIVSFTHREIPRNFDALLEKSGWRRDDIDYVVAHQANSFVLNSLAKKMNIAGDRLPHRFSMTGNTVSSTIPIALAALHEEGKLPRGTRLVLLGFGVGLSWASAAVIW